MASANLFATNKQQPAASVSLAGQLFGGAYPSARHLIYQNRKPQQNGPENVKNGVAGGAPANDKKVGQGGPMQKQKGGQYGPMQKGGQDVRQKGGCVNGAEAVNSAPTPAKEAPPAPLKPLVPRPPPPSFEDFKQFPSLK